jgi:hypothetical protein
MSRTLVAIIFVGLAISVPIAQEGGQKSLSSTMSVHVFPSEGQDTSQQSKDEAECYTWAVGNTGTDPFELAKQAEAQQQQAEAAKQQVDEAGQGAGAKGAVGGAAAGAVVGKVVSDDAGKGAAAGAAVGGIAGRRGRKSAQNQAKNDIDETSQQASKATAEQLTNFKKAFAVCLEAKDYMVKF